MPFKFHWPFSWPRRKRPGAGVADSRGSPPAFAGSEAAGTSASVAGATPAGESPAPVQLSRAEHSIAPAVPPPSPALLDTPEPEGPDLGVELLRRQTSRSTPPTLGRLGGLPAMAQTLPTVERFLQALPAPPPEPLLASLGRAGDFAANLPSLAGFTAPETADQPPSFPAQLETPNTPVDVLAPPGGMPGQVAGFSGAAPVLTPERLPALQPQIIQPRDVPPPAVLPVTAPGAQASTPSEPAQRAEGITAGAAAPIVTPAAQTPTVVQPEWPPLVTPPMWSPGAGPMMQVLSPQQTLTGNVLPASAVEPVQREISRVTGEEWASPADLVRPPEAPGERITPAQREAIENQRGQGRPLEPETRERFEQAYGQPLDEVRVHTGPTAAAAAESLNAIAFASGQDLFFTHNTYAPDSPQGLSLLGHELAHVIQQQYGVSGEADALRPPNDQYERQADQLAARALEAPMALPAASDQPANRSASIQRATGDELGQPGAASRVSVTPAFSATPSLSPASLPSATSSQPPAPLSATMGAAAPLLGSVALPAASTFTPDEQLGTAANATPLPLATGALPPDRPLEGQDPILRFSAGQVSSAPAQAVGLTSTRLPELANTPQRLGSLSEQLLSPSVMLSNRASLSRNLPGLGLVSEAGQGLPVFRSLGRGLPGLGSVPDLSHSLPDLGQSSLPDTSAITDQIPSLPGIGGGAPAMPDLGSMAQSLSSGLPPVAGLPAGLPSLGGLKPPAMPLAEGMGAVGQAASDAAGGAMAAGEQAMGSITSMGPSSADTPSAPPLPSLDKLTEHIWKEVQRKLKVERERSRGLA